MCWGGNLRLNVRAQGFIKDELEDDDEYENEKNVKMRIKTKLSLTRLGFQSEKMVGCDCSSCPPRPLLPKPGGGENG